VRNVTTIVPTRYSAKSNILPKQTLGRACENVSAMWKNTLASRHKCVYGIRESIQVEGVVLERKPMGEGRSPRPAGGEIDNETQEGYGALDIESRS